MAMAGKIHGTGYSSRPTTGCWDITRMNMGSDHCEVHGEEKVMGGAERGKFLTGSGAEVLIPFITELCRF